MEDLHGICYPGLSVKILRCDPVPVLSVAGDLQELMLRLKVFCAAVGDGTAVLLSGALLWITSTFPPPWRRVAQALACGKVSADANLRASSFRFMGAWVAAPANGFVL